MSKCWAKSTPLSLSEQMRQTLIDTLKTHFPLDLHARTLDETQVWELVLYASVQGLSLDRACQTLADVPSGNRVREHLKEAFDASAFSVLAVEEELNAALAQGLSPALTKRINRKRYDTGKKISPEHYSQIDIQHDSILPPWNYTIRPSHATLPNPN